MPSELIAAGHVRQSTCVLFAYDLGTMLSPAPARLLRATTSRFTPRGWLRIAVDAFDGETLPQLEARARAQLDEIERIAETVAQPWPRLDGEAPSPAEHWLAAGIPDAEVEAWLEAGVFWSTAAAELRAVGLGPRDVAGERQPDVTLGLAFARGDLTIPEVQRLVLGKEGA